MISEQNEALVRRYMTAFLSGDFDAARACLWDDVMLNAPGRNPLSGTHVGADAAVAFLRAIAEKTASTIRFELIDVVANDRHVIVLFIPSAKRGDEEWVSRAVSVYRVDEGRIKEITVFQHDVYAFDAFMR